MPPPPPPSGAPPAEPPVPSTGPGPPPPTPAEEEVSSASPRPPAPVVDPPPPTETVGWGDQDAIIASTTISQESLEREASEDGGVDGHHGTQGERQVHQQQRSPFYHHRRRRRLHLLTVLFHPSDSRPGRHCYNHPHPRRLRLCLLLLLLMLLMLPMLPPRPPRAWRPMPAANCRSSSTPAGSRTQSSHPHGEPQPRPRLYGPQRVPPSPFPSTAAATAAPTVTLREDRVMVVVGRAQRLERFHHGLGPCKDRRRRGSYCHHQITVIWTRMSYLCEYTKKRDLSTLCSILCRTDKTRPSSRVFRLAWTGPFAVGRRRFSNKVSRP